MSGSSGTVVVVGGGVIGVACAHYLAQAGYRVTLLEQGTVGSGCSHGNLGLICPSHVLPLAEPGAVREGLKSLFNPRGVLRIRPQLRPALYRWFWQFSRHCHRTQMLRTAGHLQAILASSIGEYRALFDQHRLNGEWKPNGLLYVFRTEEGLRQFQATDEMLTECFGVSAQRIEGDALPAFDPALQSGLAGACFYEEDGSVRPDVLIRYWSEQLTAAGVEIIEQCRLDRIEKGGGRIVALQTSRGPMTADHYVFATGAWLATT